MRLAIENYPTPQGKTCDVVDLDRDGGGGRPLIVARFFEPEYAAAFVAAAETVQSLQRSADLTPFYAVGVFAERHSPSMDLVTKT
jgi:hypothetical protein